MFLFGARFITFFETSFLRAGGFLPLFSKKTLRSSRFFRYLLLLVPFFDVFIPAYPLSDSHVLSCHFYCFPFFLVLRFPIVPYTFFEACFFGDSFFFISLLPPYFFPLPVFRLPPFCDSASSFRCVYHCRSVSSWNQKDLFQ